MHVIKVRNVHRALPEGVRHLLSQGIEYQSRNGPAIGAPEPVTTVYERPRERVMFWPERDANPFLHLFESLWMLGGRRDVAFLTQFTKNMANYSDDGVNLNGAYGYRWRHHFGIDQLPWAIETLRRDPGSRRVVLQMWDAAHDPDYVTAGGKDAPCNTQIYLRIARAQLNLTVTCRSNDVVWGAYGANAVHFSMLQEYVAARVGVAVGTMYQISNDYHAYPGTLDPVKPLALAAADGFSTVGCPYSTEEAEALPMIADPRVWDDDLALFLDVPEASFREPFFNFVVKPLWLSHTAHKAKDKDGALAAAVLCRASDWRKAAVEWLGRRYRK